MADNDQILRSSIKAHIATLCEKTGCEFFNPFGNVSLSTLAPPRGKEQYIVATGSYALGEWEPGDDVRLVVLSNVTRATLWGVLAEKLTLPPTALPQTSTIELSARDLSMTTNWQRSLLGEFETLSHWDEGDCKFYLSHCRIPSLFEHGKSCRFPSYSTLDGARSPEEQFNLRFVLDTQLIARKIDPERSSSPSRGVPYKFREQYESLRTWAKQNGILSGKLGFLDSECLIWLVYKDMEIFGGKGKAIPSGGFRGGSTSWRPETATYVELADEIKKLGLEDAIEQNIPNEDPRGPIDQLKSSIEACAPSEGPQITTIHIQSPTDRHVSGNITPANALAIKATLRNEYKLDAFIQNYSHFLRIDFETWEPSKAAQADLYSTTIPETVKSIMSDLQTEIQAQGQRISIYPRLWADPLSENGKITYAVGLAALAQSLTGQSGQGITSGEIRSIVKTRVAEIEQILPVLPNALVTTTLVTGEGGRADLRRAIAGAGAVAAAAPAAPAQEVGASTGRFRTASSAISRLRYHQSHATIEYDVGYLDRFDGLVWKGLEDWGGRATEEDDFVPEHRVRVLKRRVDDFVVWNRVERIDRT